MNPTAKTCNEWRHGLNVSRGGPEIHDAESKRVFASDHSIGNECLAAFLYRFHQASIQLVQIFFRLSTAPLTPKFLGNITQCSDAQAMCDCLQLGVVHRQIVQVSRQSDVVLDHLAVACCSRLLHCEPDFECAK